MKNKQDQFSIRTPEYLETFKPFRDPTSINQFVKVVQDYAQKKGAFLDCLDSMAGTGIVGHKIKEKFEKFHIVYQDKSKKMLSSNFYRKEDERILSDSTSLDIADKSFDIVFCRVGLNNICKSDYPKALKEYIRVLRNEGVGILQDHFAHTEEAKKVINQIETEISNIEGRSDKTYVPTARELGKLIQKARGKVLSEQSFEINFSIKDRFKSKGIDWPNLSKIRKLLKEQNSIRYEETKDDLVLVYPIITIAFKKVTS